MPEAEKYALKALELDPNLAHAHLALGAIRFYGDWDWEGADREFKRAIELNPGDSEAHRTYAFYLSALSREGEADSEIRRAEDLDPLYIATQVTAGWVFYFARRYDQAIEQCQRALELDPNSAGGYDCLGSAYLAKGMHEQAIAACRQAVILSANAPARAVGLGQAYALAGKNPEAREVLKGLRREATHGYLPPFFLAKLSVALGEHEQALTWLEESYAERDPYLAWLKIERGFDPLRKDPRFQDLLRRVGFSP
ncbi:MAG: tetratricopeptide repeat protein [Candidatus Acidiferrum sp.]